MGEIETLDQDEPLAQRMERHAYDRLIILSDGVFAIAITLAAIEIRPPSRWDQTASSLLRELGPALSAYAIAFVVISAYWMGHRRMIAMLRRVDGPATILNLLMLALVALQPAAIRLLTQYQAFGAAGHVYFAQLLLIALCQAALWSYCWWKGGMIDPSIRRPGRMFILANTVLAPILGVLIGVSIGHSKNLASGLLVAVLVAAAVGRRRLSKRFGV